MLKKKKFRICQATSDRNVAIIVHEKGDMAEGFVLTHNPKKMKDTYHKLHINPNPKDERPSYMTHRIRKGKIGDGELYSKKTLDNYLLSKADNKDVDRIYRAKKENKPWNTYLENKNTYHTREIHQNTLITGKQLNNKRLNKRKSRNKFRRMK